MYATDIRGRGNNAAPDNFYIEDIAMSATSVKDPVCGMTIEPSNAAGHAEYKGHTYYFCSASCKAKFDSDPEKYASKSA